MKRNKNLIITFGFVSFFLLIIIGFTIWVFKGNLEESISGTGQIIPKGKIRRVMSPSSGGIIAKVYVAENQEVKAGQVLMELDPEEVSTRKDIFEQQLSQLQNEASALKGALNQSSNIPSGSSGAWLNATKDAHQAELNQAEMQIQKSKFLLEESLAKKKQSQGVLSNAEKLLQEHKALNDEGG